jgi:GNAT superfamily N-acetyltransferase
MIKIRRPFDSELPALAAIWNEAWHDGHAAHVPEELIAMRTLDDFETRLGRMLDTTRVADVDGVLAGFCSLKGDELNQLMVNAVARGTGAATALIVNAEARMRAGGTETAWLSCVIGNDRAAAFYRKSGWHLERTFVEELDTSHSPFPMEVWRFEKLLKPPFE